MVLYRRLWLLGLGLPFSPSARGQRPLQQG